MGEVLAIVVYFVVLSSCLFVLSFPIMKRESSFMVFGYILQIFIL